MTDIAVFGSINMDLVLDLEDFPQPGQTIKATDFEQLPGGKGANQSVAASRLGGEVSMYGLLGNDHYAEILKNCLEKAGVSTASVERRKTSSGLAIVLVNNLGENEIIIEAGANKLVGKTYARKVSESIARSNFLLLQLETPLEGIEKLLELLPESERPRVILDPAPAVPLDFIPLNKVDILTPNEIELDTIAGNRSAQDAVREILDTRTSIILKKGEEGAEFFSPNCQFHVPSFNVKTVDTTGAGDTFNGALSVALAKGYAMKNAIRFANAAGAYATQKPGAQPSIPSLDRVKKLIQF